MSDHAAEVGIIVYPGGVRFSCRTGVRLHEALADAGFPLTVPCGGNGTCGKCSVWVTSERSFPEESAVLYGMRSSPVQCFATLQEMFPFQQVLACRYVVDASLVVWIPEESLRRDEMQIAVSHPPLETDDDADGPLTLDFLRDRDSRSETRRSGFRPADRRYAVAVDIGTTTIAAELLAIPVEGDDTPHDRCRHVVSRRNPQSEFGDDVISRIQYASESPASLERLRDAIIVAINGMIADLARAEGVSKEQIDLVALAGNTTMQQLFAGFDVQSLGHSPFVPTVKSYPVARAIDDRLVINPDGLALIFPVIGGFVGGDVIAGIVATQMRSRNVPSLLIDIGTNGEIVLWNPTTRTETSAGGVLSAAATAAGPAFEGARIRHGIIAVPGAIERVTLDDDLHVETIGNRRPRGICGSGLIDLVAELVRIGAISSSGKLLSGERLPDDVPTAIRSRFVTVDGQPAFVVVRQRDSATGSDVLLTQQDVRQVQLAAGAIRAGATLLLRAAGLKPDDLADVFLAGGFGNYIRRENAQQIGLLPPEIPTERIRFCGNTSLAGVKSVLLNAARYREMQAVAETAECVDLSTFPEFSTVFAESMFFPAPRVLG